MSWRDKWTVQSQNATFPLVCLHVRFHLFSGFWPHWRTAELQSTLWMTGIKAHHVLRQPRIKMYLYKYISTIPSLRVPVFSFTAPTWFMNEQPPGSRDQPTSAAANQPTTGYRPVQMCSQCTLFLRRAHRAHAARWCAWKYEARRYWSPAIPRVYLLQRSRAALAYFLCKMKNKS